MLGAARPPLCFTHLHLGTVHFSPTTATDTHVPAKLLVLGMEILQVVMLQFIPASQGERLAKWGREIHSPSTTPQAGVSASPHAQDHMPLHQPRGSFPLPGALLLLILLPRTFRCEQGRGASRRSPGPEPPSDRRAILGCLFVPKDPTC